MELKAKLYRFNTALLRLNNWGVVAWHENMMKLFRFLQLRIETLYKIANCSAILQINLKTKKGIIVKSMMQGWYLLNFRSIALNTQARKKGFLNYRVCVGTPRRMYRNAHCELLSYKKLNPKTKWTVLGSMIQRWCLHNFRSIAQILKLEKNIS